MNHDLTRDWTENFVWQYEDGKWGFSDEGEQPMPGKFDTKAEAVKAMLEYAKTL